MRFLSSNRTLCYHNFTATRFIGYLKLELKMIQSYFQKEKIGGFVAMAIGIVACAVGGAVLLKAGSPFYTGFCIPLVLIGFIQIMVGATVARRSDLQSEDLNKLLTDSPAEFRSLESPCIATVMQKFVVFKWVELAVIAVGLALVLLIKTDNFPRGLGAGLLVQGVIMLVFDFFAEKRGKEYSGFVRNQ